MRLAAALIAACLLTACGSMAPMPEMHVNEAGQPRTGAWSLRYTGGCTGREAETLAITKLDESEIVFDDFQLRRDETAAMSAARSSSPRCRSTGAKSPTRSPTAWKRTGYGRLHRHGDGHRGWRPLAGLPGGVGHFTRHVSRISIIMRTLRNTTNFNIESPFPNALGRGRQYYSTGYAIVVIRLSIFRRWRTSASTAP